MTEPLSRPAMTGGAVTVRLGDRDILVERPRTSKATRALALIRALGKAVPDLQREETEFRLRYEAENVVTLSRTEARMHYPSMPLFDDEGRPVIEPPEVDGKPNPRAGQLVMVPSPIDAMTEEDWERSDNVLIRKRGPSGQEVGLALFDHVLEVAEEHVFRLLALFCMPNADVKRYKASGELDQRLDEYVQEVIEDAYVDELMELAVVCGEVVDHHFVRKVRELGGKERLGNALRLVGIKWTPTRTDPETPAPSTSDDGTSSSKLDTSTDSPSLTDGDPTSSSTSPSTSSSNSPISPSRTLESERLPA